MAQESPLEQILSVQDVCITYVPLRTEVPFRSIIALPKQALVHEIPPRAALDPFKEAATVKKNVGVKKACVFLPGRKFDAAGTRFGQGGGWYDRFLSDVPKEWVRIGFCFDYQFSPETLLREPWDQVMDFVCVVAKDTGALTVYETKAR